MEGEALKLSTAAQRGLTWIKKCTTLQPTSAMILGVFSKVYDLILSPKQLY